MKTYIISILILLVSKFSFAQEKLINRTTISIFNNFNVGKYFTANENDVYMPEYSTRHHNLGIVFTENLYIFPKKISLSAGVRLITSESQIRVRTYLDDFDFERSYFKYTVKHWQITAPIYINKTWLLFDDQKRYIDIFAGTSFGIAMVSSERQEATAKKSYNDEKYVAYGNPYFKDKLEGPSFLSTVDMGFNITPFNFPNLSLGLAASYNLNKMPFSNETGSFHVMNEESHEFSFDFSRKYFNLLMQVNYSFGKKWKNQVLVK